MLLEAGGGGQVVLMLMMMVRRVMMDRVMIAAGRIGCRLRTLVRQDALDILPHLMGTMRVSLGGAHFLASQYTDT